MGATSHQLQTLRRMGLVAYRMEGKLAYYTLTSGWVRGVGFFASRTMSRQAYTARFASSTITRARLGQSHG